jgi:glycerate 2-kinase
MRLLEPLGPRIMAKATVDGSAICDDTARRLLRLMFDAAIAAAQPALCLPRHLPARPAGRTIVIGAGKASAAMASVVEQHWDGELEGLVVTRYGTA